MDKKYEYILFDVAGTLLGKPAFYATFLNVLRENGCAVAPSNLRKVHKLLSEVIHFPDRTDAKFYQHFNSELLYLLGIMPTQELLEHIFEACSYLPWEKFDDTSVVHEIDIPMGIISNFNTTLKAKLNDFFGPIFKDIFGSEALGVSKPDLRFYQKAIGQIGVAPDKILYIGDSVKLDIQPAMEIGIHAMLIDRDGNFPSSKYRIDSLNEILKYIHE